MHWNGFTLCVVGSQWKVFGLWSSGTAVVGCGVRISQLMDYVGHTRQPRTTSIQFSKPAQTHIDIAVRCISWNDTFLLESLLRNVCRFIHEKNYPVIALQPIFYIVVNCDRHLHRSDDQYMSTRYSYVIFVNVFETAVMRDNTFSFFHFTIDCGRLSAMFFFRGCNEAR